MSQSSYFPYIENGDTLVIGKFKVQIQYLRLSSIIYIWIHIKTKLYETDKLNLENLILKKKFLLKLSANLNNDFRVSIIKASKVKK